MPLTWPIGKCQFVSDASVNEKDKWDYTRSFPISPSRQVQCFKKISIITIIISVTSIIITSCMKELIFWKSILYMINDGLSTFSQKILGTHNSDFQSVNVKMLRLTIKFFLGQII